MVGTHELVVSRPDQPVEIAGRRCTCHRQQTRLAHDRVEVRFELHWPRRDWTFLAMQHDSVKDVLGAIQRTRRPERAIIAIAGPPGSGKSTTAAWIADELNSAERGSAAVLGMDGFHFDDLVLIERGWRARKGAPETFDVAGLEHLLIRLRNNSEHEIAVPVFDRAMEISRAGARIIPQSARLVIIEGNYLC
jgi:pantothenate kinase